MILVLGLAAVLWGIGSLMGAPRSARLSMIGLLYVGVLMIHVILPDGHPLRLATGESPALWLLIGGFVAIVVAYRQVLGRLRNRVQAAEQASTAADRAPLFSDTELNRYARHMVLREIGGPGQKRLKEARVLVIGAGGLGAPALQYLAAASRTPTCNDR
jgi:hypothetical protein